MLISPRKTYHKTTNSMHRSWKHKNRILDMDINKPELVWVSDITYIGTRQSPLYLSLVTDTYSKKIMEFNISNTLETKSSSKALMKSLKNRKYAKVKNILIHHSDKGVQYCSNEYQQILHKGGLLCSMTESYDPYQDAIAERVNGILKQEFGIDTVKGDIKHRKKSY